MRTIDGKKGTSKLRMIFKIIRILLFICIWQKASGFSESVLFKTYAQQYWYCDSFYIENLDKDSASFFHVIRGLQEWSEKKGDMKLAYAARLTYDRYLVVKMFDLRTAETDLLSIVPELNDNDMKYLEAEALHILADLYKRENKYSESFEYDIRSYAIYSQFTPDEFPGKADCLFGYGSTYYNFNDFINAKKYFLEGWNAIPADKKRASYSRQNSLAMTYMFLEMPDSAKYYFEHAHDDATSEKNDIWPQIINSNLANIYFKEKKYDEAIPLLQADIARSIKDEPRDAAYSLALLAEIYLNTDQPLKAKESILLSSRLLHEQGSWKEYKTKNRIFPVLAHMYSATGDLKQAVAFLDSAIAAKDSVAKTNNLLMLAGVQHKVEANHHIEEIELYEMDKKRQKWIAYFLVTGLFLFLLTGILFIRSQRLKYIHSQAKLESDKKYTESELTNAAKQLDDFKRSISEKNDLIEKFSAEIQRLRLHNSQESQDNEALLQLQQSTILSENQWKGFLSIFEKVHSGFLASLEKKIPGLSPVATKFMLLSKLRISKKEMAMILGVSVDAVKLNRQRLRAKLELPDEDFSLEDFSDRI
jgi:hypothetical protein